MRASGRPEMAVCFETFDFCFETCFETENDPKPVSVFVLVEFEYLNIGTTHKMIFYRRLPIQCPIELKERQQAVDALRRAFLVNLVAEHEEDLLDSNSLIIRYRLVNLDPYPPTLDPYLHSAAVTSKIGSSAVTLVPF
jgi:hypothetical protein